MDWIKPDSALLSNFEPDRRLWARALDLGVDWFFDGANDLVVPTVGGWRIDRIPENIPAEQIAVFGPGGNIAVGSGPVSHISFFERRESQNFLPRALKGEPQNLPPIDPGTTLPTARRSATGGLVAIGTESAATALPAPTAEAAQPAPIVSTHGISAQPYSSVFELIVLDPDQIEMLGLPVAQKAEDDAPFLYAAYGGARVTIPFRFKKAHMPPETGDKVSDLHMASLIKELNQRWGRLFGYHRRVRKFLDGEAGIKPLPDEQLRDFGDLLFETLFPDEVRRLYDVGLVLEGLDGMSDLLGGRALREVLAGRDIRLTVLNACDTGRGRMEDGKKTVALAGVALDLFGRGVPNVIANQFPVGDSAAVAFARSIYDFLARGPHL